jgi:hypothetical protein
VIGFTAANAGACGSGGGCAASSAVVDSAGNIYAALTWLAGGATQYSYKIMKSSNAGSSWSFSLNQVNSVSNNRPTMAITTLNSTKMLFAYGLYELSELKYRVFDGTNWGSMQTTSGAEMPVNVRKQISAASNSTQTAFVAFTSGGISGSLKVARFSNLGSFQAFETADSILSHSLPSITIARDNTIHIFSWPVHH